MATDDRWFNKLQIGTSFTPASLGRVWRGYLMAAYLQEGGKIMVNIYDPYYIYYGARQGDGWTGPQPVFDVTKTILPSGHPVLQSAAPPAIAFVGLWPLLLTTVSSSSGPGGTLVVNLVGYPSNADMLADYRDLSGNAAGKGVRVVDCQQLNVIQDCDTSTRPCMALFGGSLVVLYRKKNGGIGGYLGSPSNSQSGNWSYFGKRSGIDAQFPNFTWGQQPISIATDATIDGPSLAAVSVQSGASPPQNTLFCAYTRSSDRAVMITSSQDGEHWVNASEISAMAGQRTISDRGPALASDPTGQQLWLAFAGNPTDTLYFMTSRDGQAWTPAEQHPDPHAQSPSPPALIGSSAGLMLATFKWNSGALWYTTTKPYTFQLVAPALPPPGSPGSASTSGS